MSSPNKTDAKKDQWAGNAKETVGHTVGNESLESKGQAQHGSGLVQETAANVSSFVQGTVHSVTGAVQGTLGALTGNSSQEASGKVTEKKGDTERIN